MAMLKEERRRMTRTELQKWILENSGAKDAVAFKKLQQMELTGDVAEDMEKLGVMR